jgi:uncharacterized membrane protein YjgN (DUF898 family)
MQQYQDLKLNPSKIRHCNYMFRPTQLSSGALKFGGNCYAFLATAICVFIFIMFLNEISAGPPPILHILSL